MPFNNIKQAEAAVNAAKAFYLESIEKEIERQGSVAQFSRAYNQAESTIKSVISRKEFGPVRRLANRIKK